MPHKYDYDAIIIGAGISGLVCGCYLVKAGMKTLIVEKNEKPGGYCTSFRRNGFRFDACVHSLGSFGKKGHIAKILQELKIDKKIKIDRYDPQDIIIAPDYKIIFWNSMNKTISELQKIFPRETSNINLFFNFVNNCSGTSFNSLRRMTLQNLFDKYFKDDRLKAILSLPILGNAGLPPSKASAFTAVTMYKEFILDGGYYPKGGMQALPRVLLNRFKEFGGKVLLSCLAKKIKIKNEYAVGVKTEGNRFISSQYIISNVDATQTFLHLIGRYAKIS